MLWEDLSFFVVRGEIDPTVLPVAFKPLETGPRRLALAERLHNSEDANQFAIFRVGEFSVLAPPTTVWSRTGITTWQKALAPHHQTVWSFSTNCGLFAVAKHEWIDGDVVDSQVDDFRVNGEVLGLTETIGEPDEVLDAMQSLLGIEDLKSTLRNGDAMFYELLE